MARPQVPAGISHDPKHAPVFTHRVFTVFYPLINSKVIAIQDDDRTHYPFLKQWVGMEIDIENQWSLNNGTLGMDMALHKDGKHRIEYCVRLKTTEVEQILKTPHNMMGVINEQKRLVYGFCPLMLPDLKDFLIMKRKIDAEVKSKHLSPKAWTIE